MKFNKIKNVFLSALMSVSMMSSLCMNVYAQDQDKIPQVSLNKIGELKNEDAYFASTTELLNIIDKDKKIYQVLDLKGNPLGDGEYNYIDKLDNVNEHYFVAQTEVKDGFYSHLFDKNLKLVLDGNIGRIKALNNRYLEVIFIDEVTTNKDEAILYFTSSMFSMAPKEGDVLWTGHIQVFDLKTKKFVNGIDNKTSAASIEAVGDSLKVRDDNRNAFIVDGNGKVIVDDARRYNAVGNYFHYRIEDNNYQIVDCNNNKITTTEYYINNAVGTDYFIVSNDSKYGLIDKTGKEVIALQYDGLYPLSSNFLRFKSGDKNGLIDLTGKEIIPAEIDYFNSFDYGYVYFKDGDTNTVICPDGTKLEGVESVTTSTLSLIKDNQFYIFNTGKFENLGEDAKGLTKLIVKVLDRENKTCSLVSLTDGKELMGKNKYSDFKMMYGKIYAKTDKGYDIYEVTYK